MNWKGKICLNSLVTEYLRDIVMILWEVIVNHGLIRLHLITGLVLLVHSITTGQPAMSADLESLCWRDYPIPTNAINYEEAFLTETLIPDRILLNGKVVKTGMTERSLNSILRSSSQVVEDWLQRTDQEQCEYLLQLLRKHPNSMYLYKLGELKWKKMSGLFRVSMWVLPYVGTLHAFFYKSFSGATELSYLYYLTPLTSSSDRVERKKGPGYIIIRKGTFNIEWDTEANFVSIINRSGGK